MERIMFQSGCSVLLVGNLNDFFLGALKAINQVSKIDISASTPAALDIEQVQKCDILVLDLEAFFEIREYIEDELVTPRQKTLCLLKEEQMHVPTVADFGDIVPCKLSKGYIETI